MIFGDKMLLNKAKATSWSLKSVQSLRIFTLSLFRIGWFPRRVLVRLAQPLTALRTLTAPRKKKSRHFCDEQPAKQNAEHGCPTPFWTPTPREGLRFHLLPCERNFFPILSDCHVYLCLKLTNLNPAVDRCSRQVFSIVKLVRIRMRNNIAVRLWSSKRETRVFGERSMIKCAWLGLFFSCGCIVLFLVTRNSCLIRWITRV
jgi:hypothetical protein